MVILVKEWLIGGDYDEWVATGQSSVAVVPCDDGRRPVTVDWIYRRDLEIEKGRRVERVENRCQGDEENTGDN